MADGGEHLNFTSDDLVVFPAGMQFILDVYKPVSKHYERGG